MATKKEVKEFAKAQGDAQCNPYWEEIYEMKETVEKMQFEAFKNSLDMVELHTALTNLSDVTADLFVDLDSRYTSSCNDDGFEDSARIAYYNREDHLLYNAMLTNSEINTFCDELLHIWFRCLSNDDRSRLCGGNPTYKQLTEAIKNYQEMHDEWEKVYRNLDNMTAKKGIMYLESIGIDCSCLKDDDLLVCKGMAEVNPTKLIAKPLALTGSTDEIEVLN